MARVRVDPGDDFSVLVACGICGRSCYFPTEASFRRGDRLVICDDHRGERSDSLVARQEAQAQRALKDQVTGRIPGATKPGWFE